MYHIAFFYCPPSILDKVIASLTQGDVSAIGAQVRTQLHDSYQRECIHQELGSEGYIFSHRWAISFRRSIDRVPLFDWNTEIRNHDDLRQLENYLLKWADRTEWCLVPWSNAGPFCTAAIISKNERIVDDLFQSLSQPHHCEPPEFRSLYFRPAISRYAVSHDLVKHCHLVTFGEFGEWGHRVWDAMDCESNTPLILYHNESLLWNWEEIKYDNVLQFTGKDFDRINLGIYKPATKQDFLAMTATCSSEGLFWVVPGDTPLDIIREINDEVLDPDDGLAVHYTEPILDRVSWAYSPLQLWKGESVCYTRAGKLASQLLSMAPLETTRSFELWGLF